MTDNTQNATKRAKQLRQQLNYHNYQYYVKSNPTITDAEYDTLFNELKQLESDHPELITPDSPTQRTGNDLSSDFAKVKHPAPILSLANAYSAEDLNAWEERIRKLLPEDTALDYTLEPKLDGLTIVLTYEDGVLTLAATRGNGEVGDDVTANVRTINNVPLRIPVEPDAPQAPKRLVVRGEVLFLLADFERLNQRKIENDEEPFINPRNAASGTLKQKNSSITANRPMTAYFYDIVEIVGKHVGKRWDMLDYLRNLGFPLAPNIQHYPALSHIIQQIPQWEKERDDLPYEIDGLVIKVNDLTTYRELGVVGKDPRGAIAYKYPAQEATTKLIDVIHNVGRTGRVVPGAVLNPVFVSGVTISNATLHNYDFVETHDIRLGDRVIVKRSGDVIPYVIGPVPGAREGNETPIHPPKHCPFCNQSIIRREDMVDYYCTNADCPERVYRQVVFFVSRGGLDIEGLGEQTVKVLLEQTLIADEGDLFHLYPEQLLPLERFGEKKVENLMQSIDAAKQRPLAQIVTALGIEGVGGTVANLITTEYPSLNAIANATAEQLAEIDGIGPIIAKSVEEWFEEEHNQRVLDKLKSGGVRQEAEKETLASNALKGLKFVLTGSLPNLTRDEATELIESHGGRVTSSVSKKTSYVVAGESPGSKIDKATANNIPIVDETELRQLITNPTDK